MKYCTLTGIDDATPIDWLRRTHERWPFVEFGVLLSYSRSGKGRYPSPLQIAYRFGHLAERHKLNMALHICGAAVDDFIDGTGMATAFAEPYQRIQLNLRADRIKPAEVKAAIQRHPMKQIVTQHNEANERLVDDLALVCNHAVLFDKSGGRGVAPSRWPRAFECVPCGYAGGLGPDNVAQQLPRIASVAPPAGWWIDMESKLRDEADCFDPGRAEAVLRIVGAWLANRPAAA